MIMSNFVPKDDPVLHRPAAPLSAAEISSDETKELIARMGQVLAAEPDGVALAAPQIGVGKRLFIVSARALGGEKAGEKPDLVFINPRIIKLSKKKKLVEEGCLSLRWLYGEVERAEKASIEAWDETGKKFTRHGSGLMAQIFQHEVDHLDGILFSQKAINLRNLPPEEETEVEAETKIDDKN